MSWLLFMVSHLNWICTQGNETNSKILFIFLLLFWGFFEVHHMNSWKLALPVRKKQNQETAEGEGTSTYSPKFLLSSWERHGKQLGKKRQQASSQLPSFCFDCLLHSTGAPGYYICLAGIPKNLFVISGLQNAVYFVLCPPSSFTFQE